MDIRRLKPEAEITCEIENEGEPISITFRMGFISLDGIPDYVYDFTASKPAAKPKAKIPGRKQTAAPDEEQPITLTKRPRFSDVIRRAVTDAIHGWDLTDGETPIPCTAENKEKHLPLLFGFKVKRPKPIVEPTVEGEGEPATSPVDSVLVMVLADFAGRSENFLKN
jgi:hypothetical protein